MALYGYADLYGVPKPLNDIFLENEFVGQFTIWLSPLTSALRRGTNFSTHQSGIGNPTNQDTKTRNTIRGEEYYRFILLIS